VDARAGLDNGGHLRVVHLPDGVGEGSRCIDDNLCPHIPLFSGESVSHASSSHILLRDAIFLHLYTHTHIHTRNEIMLT